MPTPITSGYILTRLWESDEAAIWALKALAARQTAQEFQAESTREKNGVGFNGVDAPILTSFVKQLKQGRKLSAKQLKIVHQKLPKYNKQIMELVLEAKEKKNAQ